MPMAATSSAGLSGSTIEEKTRTILGWTTPTMASVTTDGGQSTVPTSRPAGSSKRKERPAKKSAARYTTTVSPYPLDAGRRMPTDGGVALRYQLTPPPSPIVLIGNNNSRKSSFDSSCSSFYTNSASSNSPPAAAALPISPISPNTQQPHFFVQNYPPPPCTSSSSSPPMVADARVFDRLRQLVPNLSAEKDAAYRLFTKLVSNVIDLEHQLESLKEQTRGAEVAYHVMQQQPAVTLLNQPPPCVDSSSPSAFSQQMDSPLSSASRCSSIDVPDDLMHVDVSAFKFLVDGPAFAGGSFFHPTAVTDGQRLLTVDTSVC